jgi:hypothetical protein
VNEGRKESRDGKMRGREIKEKKKGIKELGRKGEEKFVTSSQIFMAENVLWSSGL